MVSALRPQGVPKVREIHLANAWGGTLGPWFCLLVCHLGFCAGDSDISGCVPAWQLGVQQGPPWPET